MYFLLDILQISQIIKNCYFMDGKAEKDNCALANKGTTAKINYDDIFLLFYLLVTCMSCYCHTVLLGTNSTLKSLAANIRTKYEGFYPAK
jgi:uncharacterized protein (DUF2225 family)